MASSASGKQGEEVEEIEGPFKGVHTLEVQVSKSVDSQTSKVFQISDKFFQLVVNNRVGASPSSHLSIFLEKVDEDDPNVSVFVSFSVSTRKRKLSVKTSVKKKKSRRGDSSNVCKCSHGRFSNSLKALALGDFIDKSIVYDPSSGLLVDNKLVLTVDVTMLNENLLRGEKEIKDFCFPIEEIMEDLKCKGAYDVLLWAMENFSDFVDVLKKDEMTSPCFFSNGRKFCIAMCIQHGDVGLELKCDDPVEHIMDKRQKLVFGLGVVRIKNGCFNIMGKKIIMNSMEGPYWAMKASMLEADADAGYVIDGAAMIFCCIQVEHLAEGLKSQDGCELPPPDLVVLVPEESKENPADSDAEDADANDDNDVDDRKDDDADDDNDVDDMYDADEAAHAGYIIEDLRNKLEESSNRIIALGIEINNLKDLRIRENKLFHMEIDTLKDHRSREHKQFKEARFQTNVNHKRALEQMADKMKDVKIEMRKSYENAREHDKRACQENEKLREENQKLREENKKLHQDRIADYYVHQKEQLHDIAVPMMQSQHFNLGRSAGFSLGGTYSLHRPQQQLHHTPSISSRGVPFPSVDNQDLLHLRGSDMLPSSHSSYHLQTSGPPGIGLRPLNSPNTVSGMVSYDQQHQNQSQFRMQQMSGLNQSYTDQGVKSMQSAQAAPDSFGFLGLLSRIRDPDLRALALGIDLTTRGLNLNSTKNLSETFGSPWSDEPAMGDPEFIVPQCYYTKQPPALSESYFLKFSMDALFYVFFSMPKDEAQLYAANELYNRGWFYHRELRVWLTRVDNKEPLVKTEACEGGSYICFDPSTWETTHKDNLLVQYDMLEERPTLPQH